LELPIFSSGVFFLSPLRVWGCLFFHQRSFFLAPWVFGVASFFIRGLFLGTLHVWVASFFIGGLLSQWVRGLIARLCSWLRYLVPGRPSNAKLTLLAILTLRSHSFGERSFYCCFGVHWLHLIKNLTPLRASPVKKWVRALKTSVRCYSCRGGSFIVHETSIYSFDLNKKQWFSAFQEWSNTRPWGSDRRYAPGLNFSVTTIKNTSKNREGAIKIVDEWLNTQSWGLTNRNNGEIFSNRLI
jgi:hypothetical protein